MNQGKDGHKRAERFQFSAARNTAVFVCSRARDGAPVLHVSHDADGDWQFLCGGNQHGDGQSDGALLACLECVVADDLTLNELSDLCEDWTAERNHTGDVWRRHDNNEDFIRDAVTLWFNGGDGFPLLQALWSDKRGRFPGDPDADPATTALQPLLP